MFNDLVQISFQREKIWEGRSKRGIAEFILYQQFTHGVILQGKRVEEDLTLLNGEDSPGAPNQLGALFLDIYSFFMWTEKIVSSLDLLASSLNDPEFTCLLHSRKNVFTRYEAGKSHLDGLGEVLTGRFMVDFSPVNGDAFKIGGVPFNLSDLDVDFFKSLYREVVEALLSRVRRVDISGPDFATKTNKSTA